MIQLDGINHSYGDLTVLDRISFQVRRAESLAIVGPSGCGKTTLLRIIGGDLTPSNGRIRRAGRVRTVHQRSGLLPWRTVAENIELGLRNGSPLSRKQPELQDLLRLFRLERFADFYPHQLSGGMRQRAEVGRALAGETEILLLDEPFSSLDYLTRLRLRNELVELLRIRPRTVVLVTHDVTEAAQLADRILVLSDRPAIIRREIRIESMRPREPTSPEVVRVAHEILSELGLEHDLRNGVADSAVPMI
ncbi:MAG: ABC transporter ATP-binding protein [Planctomycetes bacterium]|nr:ABC transporter ATP-binding protein [Planctomycetota bacterium]